MRLWREHGGYMDFWSYMNENSFNGGINKELGSFKVGGGYAKKYKALSRGNLDMFYRI
jgi:hypothetical protein